MSPIGIEPFIRACKEHEAPQHVLAFMISRMTDLKAKAEAYAQVRTGLCL